MKTQKTDMNCFVKGGVFILLVFLFAVYSSFDVSAVIIEFNTSTTCPPPTTEISNTCYNQETQVTRDRETFFIDYGAISGWNSFFSAQCQSRFPGSTFDVASVVLREAIPWKLFSRPTCVPLAGFSYDQERCGIGGDPNCRTDTYTSRYANDPYTGILNTYIIEYNGAVGGSGNYGKFYTGLVGSCTFEYTKCIPGGCLAYTTPGVLAAAHVNSLRTDPLRYSFDCTKTESRLVCTDIDRLCRYDGPETLNYSAELLVNYDSTYTDYFSSDLLYPGVLISPEIDIGGLKLIYNDKNLPITASWKVSDESSFSGSEDLNVIESPFRNTISGQTRLQSQPSSTTPGDHNVTISISDLLQGNLLLNYSIAEDIYAAALSRNECFVGESLEVLMSQLIRHVPSVERNQYPRARLLVQGEDLGSIDVPRSQSILSSKNMRALCDKKYVGSNDLTISFDNPHQEDIIIPYSVKAGLDYTSFLSKDSYDVGESVELTVQITDPENLFLNFSPVTHSGTIKFEDLELNPSIRIRTGNRNLNLGDNTFDLGTNFYGPGNYTLSHQSAENRSLGFIYIFLENHSFSITCPDGTSWNGNTLTCDPGFVTVSDFSVACIPSGSTDDISVLNYETSWYRVMSDGNLDFIQNEPQLDVSRTELQQNIYLCEAFAIDSSGLRSDPQRIVATLSENQFYVPYGVLQSEVERIASFQGNNRIPKTVSVQDDFAFDISISCANGECPNLQTELVYDSRYLDTTNSGSIISAVQLSPISYITNSILSPANFLDFITPISAQSFAENVYDDETNAYDIDHALSQDTIISADFATHSILTVIHLNDASTISTYNSTIFLPDNTNYVEQFSTIQVQDRYFLLDPFEVSVQRYTVYQVEEGFLEQDLFFPNRFSIDGNGVSRVSADIDESLMSSPYLQSLTTRLRETITTFYYSGLCEDYTIRALPINLNVPLFNENSSIGVDLQKVYTANGRTEVVPYSSSEIIAPTYFEPLYIFNLLNPSYGFPDFNNQIRLRQGDTSHTFYFEPSPNFEQSTFNALFNQSLLPAYVTLYETAYIDSTCSYFQPNIYIPINITYDANCEYQSSVSSRNHFYTYDDGDKGSANISIACVDGTTRIPENELSYVSNDTSVVDDNGDGRYVVKLPGTAILDIYHNGTYTGHKMNVSGLCGISGYTFDTPNFDLNVGDSYVFDSVTTIPNPACLSDSNYDCAIDISSDPNLYMAQNLAFSNSYNLFFNKTPLGYETKVTSCPDSRATTQVPVESRFDSRNFYCGELRTRNLFGNTIKFSIPEIFTADKTLGLIDQTARDVLCETESVLSQNIWEKLSEQIFENPQNINRDSLEEDLNTMVFHANEILSDREFLSALGKSIGSLNKVSFENLEEVRIDVYGPPQRPFGPDFEVAFQDIGFAPLFSENANSSTEEYGDILFEVFFDNQDIGQSERFNLSVFYDSFDPVADNFNIIPGTEGIYLEVVDFVLRPISPKDSVKVNFFKFETINGNSRPYRNILETVWISKDEVYTYSNDDFSFNIRLRNFDLEDYIEFDSFYDFDQFIEVKLFDTINFDIEADLSFNQFDTEIKTIGGKEYLLYFDRAFVSEGDIIIYFYKGEVIDFNNWYDIIDSSIISEEDVLTPEFLEVLQRKCAEIPAFPNSQLFECESLIKMLIGTPGFIFTPLEYNYCALDLDPNDFTCCHAGNTQGFDPIYSPADYCVYDNECYAPGNEFSIQSLLGGEVVATCQ